MKGKYDYYVLNHHTRENMKRKFIYLLPLLIVESVLCISIILYRFGPWKFPFQKDNLLFLLIMSYNIAFALGYFIYFLKVKSYKMLINDENNLKNDKFNKCFLKILLILNTIIFIPYCYFRCGTFYPNLIKAFNDLSIAYANSTNLVIINSSIVPKTITSIGSLLTFLAPIYVYVYWSEIKVYARCALSLFSVWYFMVGLCTGRNKAIFITAIMLLMTFFILWLNDYIHGFKKQHNIAIIIRGVIALSVILIAFSYFAISMKARATNTEAEMTSENVSIAEIYDHVIEDSNIEVKKPVIVNEPVDEKSVKIEPGKISKGIIDQYNSKAKILEKQYPYYVSPMTYAYFDIEHPLVKGMPDSMKHFFANITYYLTHGYHGLSIAIRTTFDFTFGFGQAPILQGIASKILNVNINDYTYITKVSNAGYPIYLNWGTAYLLFASDITFVGVIFLMGIFGLIVSVLWTELLKTIDYISLILFISLIYNLLLITSWWQAGMTGTDFCMFYGSLLIWGIRKIILLKKKKAKSVVI